MLNKILKGTIFTGLFIIPFVPFFVSGSLFFPFITTKAFAWRIIVEIIFSAWLVLIAIAPEYRPKRTLILYALIAFIGIIGLADLLGVAPLKSFWSNFERMEGFVTLLHLGAFFLVISSFFKEREWKWWWNTSLVASLFMVIYCFFQLSGRAAIHQGGARIDGSLGNAAYLAVYMLFHFFVAMFYLVRERGIMRWAYGGLMVLLAYMVYESATRGAIMGLLGGLFVVAILNMRNRDNAGVRKLSLGVFVGILVVIGGFFMIRNTDFVKKSPVLERFASISISSIKNEGRAFVWPMALKGIKDRPILGWGQDNFNYVFNKYYSPEMFRLEPWFDRAHNIFLDWGIAGGLLGLLGYLSLYVVLLTYIWRRSLGFSHAEKSVLTGLIVAYFFHNLFVFDHLISYILFISLLAYVHARSAAAEGRVGIMENARINLYVTAIPALVILIAALYFVNIKPMIGNANLIKGLQALNEGRNADVQGLLEKAYASSRLGRPEVVEWIANSADTVLRSNITTEEKNAYFKFASDAVKAQAAELPTDARYQLIAGSFFSGSGYPQEAMKYFEKAQQLTPGKQTVYFELGGELLSQGDVKGALEYLKKAYDLDPNYTEAQIIYVIGAIYAGDVKLSQNLISKITADKNDERTFFSDNRVSSALYANNRFSDLVIFLEKRVQLFPQDLQNYVDLAIAYSKAGEPNKGITLLTTIEENRPESKNQLDPYIKAIREGKI